MDTRIEISNYHEVVCDKYESLDLPKAKESMTIIEKLKNKHPDIILV